MGTIVGVLNSVKNRISQGKIDEAIDYLIDHLRKNNDSHLNEAILLKARTSEHNRGARMGTLSHQQITLGRNQIVAALMGLIDQIPTSEEEPPEDKSISEDKLLTILFVTSNPTQTTRLRLDKEMRDIEEELKKAKHRDKFEFFRKDAARVSDLQDGLLEYEPEFIHFSGHGDDEGIILMKDNDTAQTASNESLANLFKLFSDKLTCVFLNSCFSLKQAELIKQHIPNVIGMGSAVQDSTAIEFSKTFYKALGAGKEIDFSFELAKNSIELNNLAGEDIPTLLTK